MCPEADFPVPTRSIAEADGVFDDVTRAAANVLVRPSDVNADEAQAKQQRPPKENKKHHPGHAAGPLDDFTGAFRLRGKGEAVTFATFVTRAMVQRADFDAKAARMLDDFTEAYHRDRDIHSA